MYFHTLKSYEWYARVNRINCNYYDQHSLANYIRDAFEAFGEQLRAISQMQNRKALGMLPAGKGGVCMLYGHSNVPSFRKTRRLMVPSLTYKLCPMRENKIQKFRHLDDALVWLNWYMGGMVAEIAMVIVICWITCHTLYQEIDWPCYQQNCFLIYTSISLWWFWKSRPFLYSKLDSCFPWWCYWW